MRKLYLTLFFVAVVLLAYSVFNTNRDPQPARTPALEAVERSSVRPSPVTWKQPTVKETVNRLAARPQSGDSTHTNAGVPTRDTLPSFTATLTLTVTGLKPQKSDLCIATFSSAAGFPRVDRSAATQVIAVNQTTAIHEFPIEHSGTLAIAVFQDLDGNGILSKDAYGIPTEPYGFSNDARGLMGPPSFKQAEIRISKAVEALGINLK
jgi:uncharacterized protein (DUF2141 family)